MIETMPGWKRVDSSHPYWYYDLRPGTLVKFGSMGRNLAGKTGVFEKFLRKNVSINVGGKSWSVPPCFITDYAPPTSDVAIAYVPPKTPKVSTSAHRFADEVEAGDVILCWRGQFDVVKVNRIDSNSILNGKFSGTVIGGRANGKSYKYQTAWYVQKLDDEKISIN